jgi:hypothetical protein
MILSVSGTWSVGSHNKLQSQGINAHTVNVELLHSFPQGWCDRRNIREHVLSGLWTQYLVCMLLAGILDVLDKGWSKESK